MAHSRIFVITDDLDDFNDYLDYEDIVKVAPAADSYGDSDLEDDIRWLSREIEKMTGDSNPIRKEGDYYSVDDVVLLKYLEKGFKDRLLEAERIIERLKKSTDVPLDLWRLSSAVSPDYSFLFYYDNCLYNENELFFELREYFVNENDPKPVYIVKTYDYHF